MFNMVQFSILIEKICCAKSVFQVSSFVANLGEATARKFTLEDFFMEMMLRGWWKENLSSFG